MRPALLIILLYWLPLACGAQGFYKAVPIADANILLDARGGYAQALRLSIPMYTVRIIYTITPATNDTTAELLQQVRHLLPPKIDWLAVEGISKRLTLPMLPDTITTALYHRKGCVRRFLKQRRSRCISYTTNALNARTWHHEWPASIFDEKAYLCLRLPNTAAPFTFRIQAVAVQAY
jgi:hypothetical protein